MDFKIYINVIYFSLGVYVVFHTIYWIKTYTFHKSLKELDPKLHQEIKMKWIGNKPFLNFIFKKEFYKHTNIELVKRCKQLYFFGSIGQWGFNIAVILFLIDLVVRFIKYAI